MDKNTSKQRKKLFSRAVSPVKRTLRKAGKEVAEVEEKAEKIATETEDIIEEEIDGDDCCHIHDHKCKFGFACVAIILVAVCTVGEYLFDNKRYSELSKNNISTMDSVKKGREQVSELQQQLTVLSKKISSLEQTIGNPYTSNDGRKKWKVWIALKNKLEAGEAFEKELSTFNNVFSYDQELIQLVRKTVSDIGIESQKKSTDDVMDTVKKYMNKVVSVRKIDYSKLSEISGYVITSMSGELSHE